MTIEKGSLGEKGGSSQKSENANVSPEDTKKIDSLTSLIEDQKKQYERQKEELDALKSQIELITKMGAAGGAKSIDARELAEAIVIAGKKDSNAAYYESPSTIDPDDYVSEGVEFICHRVWHCIVDDKRNGHSVKTPFGRPIVFEHGATIKDRIGGEFITKPHCKYKSNSKKEIEWLRSHSDYKIVFHEAYDDKNTAIESHYMQQFASEYIRTMDVSNRTQILDLGKKFGINLGQDLMEIRREVALRMASDKVAQIKMEEDAKTRERLVMSIEVDRKTMA